MAPRTRSNNRNNGDRPEPMEDKEEPGSSSGGSRHEENSSKSPPNEERGSTNQGAAKSNPKNTGKGKAAGNRPKVVAKPNSATKSRATVRRPKSKPASDEDEYSSSDETTFFRPFRGLLPDPVPGYRGGMRSTGGDSCEKYEYLSYEDVDKEYRPFLKYFCMPNAPYY